MTLISNLRRLYSLDTLDTRFTKSKSSSPIQAEAQPSKWRTPEFYLYYVIFIVVVPQMFKVSYDVSKSTLRVHTVLDDNADERLLKILTPITPNSSLCFHRAGYRDGKLYVQLLSCHNQKC